MQPCGDVQLWFVNKLGCSLRSACLRIQKNPKKKSCVVCESEAEFFLYEERKLKLKRACKMMRGQSSNLDVDYEPNCDRKAH